MSLKHRAIKSVFWVTMANIISRVFNVVALLIAARVLSKADIGLYGLISTILMILLVVVSFGFDTWYQKSTYREKYHYNSFVGVSILSTIIIAILLFFSATTIGKYYHSNQLILFTRIVGVYFLLGGITQLFSQHLAKHLEFKYTSVATIARQLVQSVVTIILVLLYKDALALIIGLVAGGIVEFAILFIKTRRVFIASLRDFSIIAIISSIAQNWRQTFSLMGGKVVNTIARTIPPAIFGRTLGLADTGLFTTMDNFISQPLYLITGSVSTVSLPVLAKVDTTNLASASLKISRALLLISAPLFIVLWIFPKEIINLVLGAKWTDGAVILQLLMVAVFINIAVSPISSLFAIREKPHQLFYWNLILLVGNIAALIIGSRYGLTMAVLLYAIINTIMRLALQVMTGRLLSVGTFYFLKVYFEYLKIWLPVVALCVVAQMLFNNNWVVIPTAFVVVVVYYFAITFYYPHIIREARGTIAATINKNGIKIS